MKYFLFILCIGLSLVSCLPEETEAVNLHDELVPYFDRFAEEADERGYSFNWKEDRIEGYISDISDREIFGQCVHDNLDPNSVIIDETFWKRSTDLDREFIVFHELGHCFLNRNHYDEEDEDGICVSIMNSGSPTCRGNYTHATREAYLDELFML